MDNMQQAQFSEEPLQERVEAWIARFAPLVMNDDAIQADQIQNRLLLIEDLARSAPEMLTEARGTLTLPPTLHTTFDQAVSQLPAIEEGLRRRLAEVARGNPDGLVDLTALMGKLAETKARTEMGVNPLETGPIEEVVQHRSLAAAGFLGIFATGWTAFTTLHAIFMIGGMASAFGPAALFLLLFYAIFFFAGFAMYAAAYQAGCKMTLRLEGRRATVKREFGPIVSEKAIEVAEGSEATIEASNLPVAGNKNAKRIKAVTLRDASGKMLQFPAPPGSNLSAFKDRINRYLRAQSNDSGSYHWS